MEREVFCLSDAAGNTLRENSSLGMLIAWLIEHEYFLEHPGVLLTITEDHTPGFSYEVTEHTTSRDAINAWNRYNHYI